MWGAGGVVCAGLCRRRWRPLPGRGGLGLGDRGRCARGLPWGCDRLSVCVVQKDVILFGDKKLKGLKVPSCSARIGFSVA